MFGVVVALAVALPRLVSLAASPVELPKVYPPAVEAISSFTLTISPSGEVERCRLLATSGWPTLDAKGCAAFAKARFAAAADSHGAPVQGVLDMQLRWPQGEAMVGSVPPDVELTLDRMPAGVAGRPVSDVAVTIGPNGDVEACEVTQSSGSAALDAAACASGVKAAQLGPTIAADGSPVRAIHALSVRFVSYARFGATPAMRLGDLYPERSQRLGVTGLAIAKCQASAQGDLSSCMIAEEDPPGFEFGLALLRFLKVSHIRVAPGQQGEVFIPAKFNIGSKERPSPQWLVIDAAPIP